jgi:hypothetical protein
MIFQSLIYLKIEKKEKGKRMTSAWQR